MTLASAVQQTRERDAVPLGVLLLSPIAGLDPANGDVTYAQQLLDHPPDGVEYVGYATAFERGWLRDRGRDGRTEAGPGLGGRGDPGSRGQAAQHSVARRRELIFPEPLPLP